MAGAASPLDVPFHPDFISILSQRVMRQPLKRSGFRSVVDLQVAINGFVANANANPLARIADPKRSSPLLNAESKG